MHFQLPRVSRWMGIAEKAIKERYGEVYSEDDDQAEDDEVENI